MQLRKFLAKRIAQYILVMWLVSMASFVAISAAKGDPALAMFGEQAQKLTQEERDRINRVYGMGETTIVRYGKWLGEVMRGNMGMSYREGRKVIEVIAERIPNTMALFGASTTAIVMGSIFFGLQGGFRPKKWGRAITLFSILFSSMPTFWLGMVCMLIFSIHLGWLPSSGNLVLPLLVMVVAHIWIYAKMLQEKIRDELQSYHVLVARANGVDERFIVRGVLKNSMLGYLGYVGTSIPSFFGGAITMECLFSWAGIGQLSVVAATNRDYPLLMGCIMFTGVVVILAMLIMDLAAIALNPRLMEEWRY